ncbi:MAG: metallophosphoesterase [Nanoarchaeota archaeon]
MNLHFENTFDSIIVCGDIHGDIMPLVFKTEQYKIQNSLVIVAGDVGIGFHKDGYYLTLFKKVEARLKKSNNIFLFIRGNHDDPDKWLDHLPFQKHWQDGNSHVRFVKDYTVVSAHTDRRAHNILCVGGAISIDRVHRTQGINYWANEPFVYDEEKASSLEGITDIITHSCPDFCEPILKGGIQHYISVDANLEADCDKERKDHTLLYNKVKEKNQVQRYFYGHYHFYNKTNIGETMFRLCDIMELVEI